MSTNDYKFKVESLRNLVNTYNRVHESNYRIETDGSEDSDWVEIIHDGDSFSGCLLRNIAALASVYVWSFGIHYRISSVTGKPTMYCLI